MMSNKLTKIITMIDNSELLRKFEIKVTAHKLAILEVFSKNKHVDINQIISGLKANSIEISLATIYRILASFEKHNIISKLNFGDDQAIYELNDNSQHHDHLICTKCKCVIEFNHPQIEALQLEVAKDNQFTVLNHTMNLYGICSKCNN